MFERVSAWGSTRRLRRGLRCVVAVLWLIGCGQPESGPAQPMDMTPDLGTDSGPDVGPDVGDDCEPGYTRRGDRCVDIDECADDPCDSLVDCINLGGSFTCTACPAGYEGNGRDRCLRVCPDGEHDGGDHICRPDDTCSPGFVLDEDGACAPLECPDGQHFDGLDGCAPEDECADGFVLDRDRDCVAAPCPEGQHDDGTGDCAPLGRCADGFALDDAGRCRALSCPADDAHEPDDGPDEAGPLPAEGLQGIACADDADVFALDPGPRCRVVVRLSVIDGAPTLSLVDDAGALLAAGDGGDPIEARIEPESAVFARVDGAGIYRISAEYEGHDGGDGACVDLGTCSMGWAVDGDGACTLCAAGFHDGGAGGCVPEGRCADGYALGGGGTCVPVGQCADGFRDDGTGECAPVEGPCARGFAEDGAGGCALPGVCAERHAVDRLDRCRRVAACAEGRDNGLGVCQGQCAAGFHPGGPDPYICLPLGDCQPGAIDRGDGICAADCLAAYARAGAVCVGDFTCEGPDADDPIESEEADGPAALLDGDPRFAVLCPDDVDRFELDPPIGCSARVLLRFDAAEGALTLEAGPEGEPVLGSDAPGGQRLVLEALPGPVVLRVRGADAVRYALRVDIDGHDGGDGRCRPLGECAPGYTFDGEGACGACAAGYVDDGRGRCVLDGQCADEFHDGGDGVCVPENECSPGFADGDGPVPGIVCVPEGTCAAGYHDGNGDAAGVPCVPDDRCSDGFHDGNGDGVGTPCLPLGACSDGFHDGGDGACVGVDDCSAGFHDGNGAEPGNRCLPLGECARGLHDGGDGVCVLRGSCRPGYVDRGDGGCTAFDMQAPDATACIESYEYVIGVGACACESGTDDGGDGICVAPGLCSAGFRPAAPEGSCVPVADCAVDHHATPWGECRPTAVCAADRRDDGIGACVAFDRGCADGFFDRGGVCAAAPYCAPGHHDGGDGLCVADDRCAPGFRRAAAGCVPAGEACDRADFDTARVLEEGPPVGGVVCGLDPDTVTFALGHRCGSDLRLVADDPQRVIDLVLYDGDRNPLHRVEVIDGRARLWIPPDAPREGFVQVVPVEPGAGAPVPYRLDLVRDPLRCAPCPDGTEPDGAGGCIPPVEGCAPGFRDGGDGTCVPLDACSVGFRDDGLGRCAPFDVCAPGYALGRDFECQAIVDCPDGQLDDGGGICGVQCDEGAGYADGGGGVCVAASFCAAGYDDDGAGRCTPVGQGADCAQGFALDAITGLCLLDQLCPDEGDESSSVDDAQDLELQRERATRVYGSLCFGDTGDWYRIRLEGSLLRVRLRFDHAGNDMALRILDEAGVPLAEADSGSDDEVVELPETFGTVLVEVTGAMERAGYRLDLVQQ